jgi:ElaB/YqjD/DUF883 family membrane-anchored ribosome-binding protein
LTAAAGQPYAIETCRARLIVFGQQQERISKVETGLVRLEVTVEQLANAMASDHKANQEVRREDRNELKEHITRMEKSVSGLAEGMQKIAERTSAVDNSVLVKQSQASGAADTAKYIIGVLLALATIFFAYKQGERNDYIPPPEHYSQKAIQ